MKVCTIGSSSIFKFLYGDARYFFFSIQETQKRNGLCPQLVLEYYGGACHFFFRFRKRKKEMVCVPNLMTEGEVQAGQAEEAVDGVD